MTFVRCTALPLLVVALLTGCGVTQPTYEAPQRADSVQTSATVDQSYDETWDHLIQYTSQRFFAIDNYEKDSGLMTLSFSSDPSRFVDCGYIETDGPPSYEGPYVAWFEQRSDVNMNLDGRMNLTVQEASEAETMVSVNTRYVVQIETMTGATYGPWAFNTGGSATQSVPSNNFGATDTRTCRPTHEAEQVILEGLTSQ